jgi:hypothetical protein
MLLRPSFVCGRVWWASGSLPSDQLWLAGRYKAAAVSRNINTKKQSMDSHCSTNIISQLQAHRSATHPQWQCLPRDSARARRHEHKTCRDPWWQTGHCCRVLAPESLNTNVQVGLLGVHLTRQLSCYKGVIESITPSDLVQWHIPVPESMTVTYPQWSGAFRHLTTLTVMQGHVCWFTLICLSAHFCANMVCTRHTQHGCEADPAPRSVQSATHPCVRHRRVQSHTLCGNQNTCRHCQTETPA